MNTPLHHRFAASIASVLITVTLFSAVVSNAEPPVSGSLLAHAATPIVL